MDWWYLDCRSEQSLQNALQNLGCPYCLIWFQAINKMDYKNSINLLVCLLALHRLNNLVSSLRSFLMINALHSQLLLSYQICPSTTLSCQVLNLVNGVETRFLKLIVYHPQNQAPLLCIQHQNQRLWERLSITPSSYELEVWRPNFSPSVLSCSTGMSIIDPIADKCWLLLPLFIHYFVVNALMSTLTAKTTKQTPSVVTSILELSLVRN